MCRGAGEATRDNLKELIAHQVWLRSLPDPAPMLTSISEAKIGQWASEARRLKARELREYVAAKLSGVFGVPLISVPKVPLLSLGNCID
jgi:hypothetical protein